MAKQESNKNEFDSMWKKQMQSAQITSQQKDALYNLVVGYAKARADQAKGSLAASVKEVVPNVDQNSHLFQQLMNIVNASRDVWTTKQNELIDLNRVHTNIVTVPPSSFICTLLGKDVIKITIVTSERTDESFKTGKDNEIDLFPKEKSLEK